MSLAGPALVWALVVALAFAPATTVPHVAGPSEAPVEGPSALDLSARWPILLDANTRTLAPAGSERALPRAQRTRRAPRRPVRALSAARPRERVRPPSLPELGRRQSDGG
ncbi:MAG: hypothetical protein EA416_09105 [Trueperaceae bacterium]|nr:MAG: hypothetical protein EA416_09105 [Trueperaceae bacterium]